MSFELEFFEVSFWSILWFDRIFLFKEQKGQLEEITKKQLTCLGVCVVNEKVQLCGTDVLLWAPHEVVDDTTLVLLDQNLAFEGMKEELANMTKCKVGQVLSSGDVEEVKRSCSYLRVIQARWVTAFKSVDRVRARVVAKDIRSKESARSLGCSSPTPSCEVVQILLSIAATRGWRLRALDVSHAFMHSP